MSYTILIHNTYLLIITSLNRMIEISSFSSFVIFTLIVKISPELINPSSILIVTLNITCVSFTVLLLVFSLINSNSNCRISYSHTGGYYYCSSINNYYNIMIIKHTPMFTVIDFNSPLLLLLNL